MKPLSVADCRAECTWALGRCATTVEARGHEEGRREEEEGKGNISIVPGYNESLDALNCRRKHPWQC